MATTKRSTSKKKAAGKTAAKKAAPAKKKGAPKKAAPAKKAPAKKTAARKVKGVPEGFHTIVPGLVFKDALAAIEWYGKAFGAKALRTMMSPDGKAVWHAAMKIGDSVFFLNDESPMGTSVAPHGPRTTTSTLQLCVPDVDAWAKRAIEAGAEVVMPVGDMFWGDRMGVVVDRWGNEWVLAEHVRDITPEEMASAAAAAAKGGG